MYPHPRRRGPMMHGRSAALPPLLQANFVAVGAAAQGRPVRTQKCNTARVLLKSFFSCLFGILLFFARCVREEYLTHACVQKQRYCYNMLRNSRRVCVYTHRVRLLSRFREIYSSSIQVCIYIK